MDASADWLALVIGNSRLHWAIFNQHILVGTWHTPHLTSDQAENLQTEGFRQAAWQAIELDWELLPEQLQGFPLPFPIPLWVASVVEAQAHLWATYPRLRMVTREDFQTSLNGPPLLKNGYATLGIDRILCLVGAGMTYGWPMLVIDTGTALTFTTGNNHDFLGGAILPGLSLQVRALSGGTDALPHVSLPPLLPQRWAKNTVEAIQSGLIYTQLAGIKDFLADWWRIYPEGQAILTGGDSTYLLSLLQQNHPDWAERLRVDPHLMFRGMAAYRGRVLQDPS